MSIPSSGYDSATIANPSSAQTDFTLIIDLSRMSTSWWADAENTGATRGRAAKNDGTTELATDWIDYNHGAETGLLRVKWAGTLASSGTQIIRIFPPKAANSAYIASDTYGSDNAYANWGGYWPDAGTVDRTGNLTAGSAIGGVTVGGATGKIGAGTDFTSDTEYIDFGDQLDINWDDAFTISLWIESDSLTGDRHVLTKQDRQSPFNGWRLAIDDGNAEFELRQASGNQYTEASDADVITVNVFGQVVCSYDGSVVTIYSNGSSVASTNANDTLSSGIPTSISLNIASRDDGQEGFDGVLNEVKFENAARSADWISEEYDQTNDNATFWGTWVFTSAGATFNEAIAETVGLAETQAITLDILGTVAESIGLTDAQSVALDMVIAIAEAIGLTETQDAGANTFEVSIAEGIGLSETQSATFEISIAVAEGIGLTDLQSTIATFTAQIAEAFGLTDVSIAGDLASGKLCVTISGSGPTITIVGTESEITITGTAPEIDISGEGC